MGGETEAQKGEVTFPRSCSRSQAEPSVEPRDEILAPLKSKAKLPLTSLGPGIHLEYPEDKDQGFEPDAVKIEEGQLSVDHQQVDNSQ